MIVDVPTPGEFQTAGVNQLYLAWKITIGAQETLAGVRSASVDPDATDDYWRSVQPELANAYSLIQQAMELALKGRIATVSPFLLLGNPADWPGRGATSDLSFGELPTLDASKLVKVHNALVKPALDDAFATFWEDVRRDRNRIMHSTSRPTFTAGDMVRTILTAVKALFNDMPWSVRLLAIEAGQKYAIFGLDDHVYSSVVSEVACAIDLLSTADGIEFFGFDSRQHAYVCPACYASSDRDFSEALPKLAQFILKEPGTQALRCTFCETVTAVDRADCEYPGCPGTAISDTLCLTCLRNQDEQFDVGLAFSTIQRDSGRDFEFVVGRESDRRRGRYRSHRARASGDEAAIEYGKRMLEAPHLRSWQTVSIFQWQERPLLLAPGEYRTLGHWTREVDSLAWHADTLAYQPSINGLV
jgi:hypothetical protein